MIVVLLFNEDISDYQFELSIKSRIKKYILVRTKDIMISNITLFNK